MDTDRVWLCVYRLLQLFSTCAAFSLVASLGTGMGAVSHWSMFIWCFCFVITLITFIVQLGEYQPSLPFSGRSFLFTYACLAAVFCLSASIMYAITYIQFLPHGPFRDQATAATAFSCIACVLYALEGVFLWLLFLGETTFYFATIHGLFKLLETSVACIIFAFISSTYLHQHQPALVWCVAVYSVCFTLGAVAMLLKLVKFENRLYTFFPRFLLGQTVLSVLLYASALVLWPLYQFNEEFGGQPQRSSDASCSDELLSTLCIWDQKLTVAILTAINLLIYVADMAYWIHFIFISFEAANQSPRPGESCSGRTSARSFQTPPGWQPWSPTLCYFSLWFLNVAPPWSHAGLGSFLKEEASHVKAKMRGGDSQQSLLPCHPVPTALLSPHGSSLFTPEAALLWMGLCPLRWQLLLVMAAGR
ncbi:myeloid-associated differentiation marker-like [Dama dama]